MCPFSICQPYWCTSATFFSDEAISSPFVLFALLCEPSARYALLSPLKGLQTKIIWHLYHKVESSLYGMILNADKDHKAISLRMTGWKCRVQVDAGGVFRCKYIAFRWCNMWMRQPKLYGTWKRHFVRSVLLIYLQVNGFGCVRVERKLRISLKDCHLQCFLFIRIIANSILSHKEEFLSYTSIERPLTEISFKLCRGQLSSKNSILKNHTKR